MPLEIDINDLSQEDKDALIRSVKILSEKGYKIVSKDALVLENEIPEFRDKTTEGDEDKS